MSTFLQMINRVLTATGDGNDLVDTGATSISDVGHLKVAQFVNDMLEEVEDAAQWRVLRQRLVTTSSAQQRLIEMDFAQLLFMDQNNSNQVDSTSGPAYFALNPTATGMEVYVWPRTSNERTIELDMVVPQSRFSPTSSADLGTTIKVPNIMLQHGATWWTLEDRGEELGPRGEAAKLRYDNMLAAAVAAEMSAQGLDDLVPV
jgi:hypothetical protein